MVYVGIENIVVAFFVALQQQKKREGDGSVAVVAFFVVL